MWIKFSFWVENLKFFWTIFKDWALKWWLQLYPKSSLSYQDVTTQWLVIWWANVWALSCFAFGIINIDQKHCREFSSQPSRYVSREYLKGECQTIEESSPAWPEKQQSVVAGHSDCGPEYLGPKPSFSDFLTVWPWKKSFNFSAPQFPHL